MRPCQRIQRSSIVMRPRVNAIQRSRDVDAATPGNPSQPRIALWMGEPHRYHDTCQFPRHLPHRYTSQLPRHQSPPFVGPKRQVSAIVSCLTAKFPPSHTPFIVDINLCSIAEIRVVSSSAFWAAAWSCDGVVERNFPFHERCFSPY